MSMVINDDPLADSQANACSFEFALAMQSLEDDKNPVGILIFETNTVISDGDAYPTILFCKGCRNRRIFSWFQDRSAGNFYFRRNIRPREFKGVANDVEK